MKPNVGSILGLTTVISRWYRLRDRFPVGRRCAAQRIDADLQPRRANHIKIDHAGKVLHVGLHKIDRVGGGCFQSGFIRRTFYIPIVLPQQIVRAILNPFGNRGIGRAAFGRIVFEAAVGGRIVRRRDHDAVGQARGATAIVSQNRARDDGRRREAARALNEGFSTVGGQHFQGRALCRRR